MIMSDSLDKQWTGDVGRLQC